MPVVIGPLRALARRPRPRLSLVQRVHRACSATASSSAANAAPLKLTLYTGPQCSLCDDVKEVIHAAAKDVPAFRLELYNIRDDSLPDVHKWRRLYQYDIPVLHLNGKEIARHRLEKTAFIATMRNAANTDD